MGHKHTREDILDGALEASFDEGLSQLTFGRLAKRLGISDRVIVYYVPTKTDLLSAVIIAMGEDLQLALADAFTTPARDHVEVVQRAWPVLITPESDRVFSLFFEANGLASVGIEPYASLVPALVGAWVEWVESMIDDGTTERRPSAEAAIAMIDGLLLVRQLLGPEAADRAAATLGVR